MYKDGRFSLYSLCSVRSFKRKNILLNGSYRGILRTKGTFGLLRRKFVRTPHNIPKGKDNLGKDVGNLIHWSTRTVYTYSC